MNIILLQTSDKKFYRPLLEETALINRIYCKLHNITYKQFVGVKRGYHPWQATFNRIPLLSELSQDRSLDWLLFLDADAYIHDLNFPIHSYLAERADYCLIIAPGTDSGKWDVNAGVFFLNMKNLSGQRLIEKWSTEFMANISDQDLRYAYYPWSTKKNDQDMLHSILRYDQVILNNTLIEHGFMNYSDGSFVRQVLRSGGRSVGDRVKRARADIQKLLEELPSMSQVDQIVDNPNPIEGGTVESRSNAASSLCPERSLDPVAVMEQFAAALYRCLLFREPDLPGLAKAVNNLCSGRLTFETALKSCLDSPEFKAKINQFVARQSGPASPVPGATLTALANRHKSDKGTRHGVPPHRYTYLYDLLFSKYRPHHINLLEIGLCVGGPEVGGPIERSVNSPSLEMWLQFFPNAHVYGFDISDFSHLRNPRFTFVRGDAGSIEDLQRLADEAAGYDVVIDDGSHASRHQQLAFRCLFPKLRAGGTYIIEDVHWQPQVYERDAGNLPKTADFMISYFEKQSYLANEVLSEDFMLQVQEFLDAFAWFPAFDGTASKPKLLVFTKSC